MTLQIGTVLAAGAPVTGIVEPIGFGVAATIATLTGGLLGLRLSRRLVLVLGLTAGIVLGVALFDLVPEALALGAATLGARGVLACVAGGLGGYMVVERALNGARRGGALIAHLGPAALTLHSFMDGLGIGWAFQVSPRIGWVVAVAVLTHDIADGINTVGLCLAADRRRGARRWLLANGLAPLVGVLVGTVAPVPEALMAPLMATFAGIFLYIGACQLVPRSQAADPRVRITLASVAGMVLMLGVTFLAR